MTIARKIKIRNLVFHSIQLIPDLSCKFEHFEKKKFVQKCLNISEIKQNKFIYWWGALPLTKKLPGSGNFF